MPTIVLPVEDNEIRLHAQLGVLGDSSDLRTYEGIVDTGAQMTGITQRIVDELKVSSVGMEPVVGIEGQPKLAPIFRIMIGIGVPTPQVGPEGDHLSDDIYVSGGALKVMLLEDWKDEFADVLLGMDMLVGFHITMFSGQFILSN